MFFRHMISQFANGKKAKAISLVSTVKFSTLPQHNGKLFSFQLYLYGNATRGGWFMVGSRFVCEIYINIPSMLNFCDR
jgi:hypothetical protein